MRMGSCWTTASAHVLDRIGVWAETVWRGGAAPLAIGKGASDHRPGYRCTFQSARSGTGWDDPLRQTLVPWPRTAAATSSHGAPVAASRIPNDRYAPCG